jgi:anaerobic dimethyl sulfoxide reductase subunit A
MTDGRLKKTIETSSMSRRSFLRWGALVGSAAASSKGMAGGFRRRDPRHALVEAAQSAAEERMVRTGCPSHNCGGRCLLKVFVRDGRIVRIETDDRPGDTVADPQLRACVRGRAYRKRQYHPGRLQYPLRRVGKRGEGKFQLIRSGSAGTRPSTASPPSSGASKRPTAIKPSTFPTAPGATTRSTAARPPSG